MENQVEVLNSHGIFSEFQGKTLSQHLERSWELSLNEEVDGKKGLKKKNNKQTE